MAVLLTGVISIRQIQSDRSQAKLTVLICGGSGVLAFHEVELTHVSLPECIRCRSHCKTSETNSSINRATRVDWFKKLSKPYYC